MMLKIGFHRAGLASYTGFKSSPYTEGALFYGERLVDYKALAHIESQAGLVEEPRREVACEPGST
jgi:hypothetical protein